VRRSLQRAWLNALTASIALLYGWAGLAAQDPDRTLGLVGAVAIMAALAVASRCRPAAIVLLLLGARVGIMDPKFESIVSRPPWSNTSGRPLPWTS
jgi:hypothetical protein